VPDLLPAAVALNLHSGEKRHQRMYAGRGQGVHIQREQHGGVFFVDTMLAKIGRRIGDELRAFGGIVREAVDCGGERNQRRIDRRIVRCRRIRRR
jgi:hypothetical protein